MKKSILGKLALALMVAASVQTAAVGVEVACLHPESRLKPVRYCDTNYRCVDLYTHSFDRYEVYKCEMCDQEITRMTIKGATGSHDEDYYTEWYYNQMCKFTFCKTCGAQLHVSPIN